MILCDSFNMKDMTFLPSRITTDASAVKQGCKKKKKGENDLRLCHFMCPKRKQPLIRLGNNKKHEMGVNKLSVTLKK